MEFSLDEQNDTGAVIKVIGSVGPVVTPLTA